MDPWKRLLEKIQQLANLGTRLIWPISLVYARLHPDILSKFQEAMFLFTNNFISLKYPNYFRRYGSWKMITRKNSNICKLGYWFNFADISGIYKATSRRFNSDFKRRCSSFQIFLFHQNTSITVEVMDPGNR